MVGCGTRLLSSNYLPPPCGWINARPLSGSSRLRKCADGRETEYDIRGTKYWVPVNGTWREVPDEALLTEPNKFGRPMLWLDSLRNIRCFIPGTGS